MTVGWAVSLVWGSIVMGVVHGCGWGCKLCVVTGHG